MNSYTGAGIVVFFDNRNNVLKDFEKSILYLCLENHDGTYDFPKGCADINRIRNQDVLENPFVCAVRETKEEANIDHDDLVFNYGINRNSAFECGEGLLLFIGEVLDPEVIHNKVRVLANPHTGIKEHKEKIMWLSKNVCKEKLPKYLCKGLKWASKKIDLI